MEKIRRSFIVDVDLGPELELKDEESAIKSIGAGIRVVFPTSRARVYRAPSDIQPKPPVG